MVTSRSMFWAEDTTSTMPFVAFIVSVRASSMSVSVSWSSGAESAGRMFVPSIRRTSTLVGGLRNSSSKRPDFLPWPRMSPV